MMRSGAPSSSRAPVTWSVCFRKWLADGSGYGVVMGFGGFGRSGRVGGSSGRVG